MSLSLSLYIYIYVYTYIHIYIYILPWPLDEIRPADQRCRAAVSRRVRPISVHNKIWILIFLPAGNEPLAKVLRHYPSKQVSGQPNPWNKSCDPKSCDPKWVY